MSGHSKWHNIQKTKGAADAKKAKVFTKYAREMAIAIREGGSADPNANSKLAATIARAKTENVPNDNIKRTLDKYKAGGAAENYEYITYEGYGPGGIAVIVDCLSDNRNRTVAEVRHHLDKYGKGMGNAGCVSWQFDKKGVLVMDGEDKDEEAVMMQAIEAGAEDFVSEDDVFEIYTSIDEFDAVRSKLQSAGFEFLEAEIQMVPQSYISLTDEEDIKNMDKMLEALEENDDVQNVWHNWDNEE